MANTLKIRAKEFTALTKALKDKAKQELMISMADPLPHPSEDKPLTEEELKEKQKKQPGSSPRTPFPFKLAGLHHDNKAGNVDEVWKIRNHPNYKSLPSNEQWLKNLEKARGMVKTADSRALRDHLKPYTKGEKGYDSQGGSLRDVPDKLRKNLLIQGVGKYKA